MMILVDVSNEREIGGLLSELKPTGLDLVFPSDRARSVQRARPVTAAISFGRPVGHSLRVEYPALRFIQLLSAGADSVDLPPGSWPGLIIADNAGLNSTAVAEHTVMLMLMLLRQGLAGDQNVRAGAWQRPPLTINDLGELENRLVGIVGMGRIGAKVAQRVAGFGARVQYHDIREVDVTCPGGMVRAVSLDELVRTSDIVSLHVPLTASTAGLIDRAVIARMKRECLIINTSRGAVVVVNDLADALERRLIRGAGLDVFPSEPAVPARLTALGNVVLSPHRAGSSAENWRARVRFAYANLLRFAEGRQPKSVIR